VEASRKGFRDTGRGGGSKGEGGPLEAGDAARLRKGLLEERLRFKVGEGRESKKANRISLAGGFMHVNGCMTVILWMFARLGFLKRSDCQLDTLEHLDKWGGPALRCRCAPKIDCRLRGNQERGTDLNALVGRAT